VNARGSKAGTTSSLRVGAVLVALVASLDVVGAGLARTATTVPGTYAVIVVDITANHISVGDNSLEARGVNVTFFVRNHTSKPARFSILGRTTRPIKPGKHRTLTMTLVARGLFRFSSILGGGRRLSGVFTVY
jgi:hypothetical protein